MIYDQYQIPFHHESPQLWKTGFKENPSNYGYLIY